MGASPPEPRRRKRRRTAVRGLLTLLVFAPGLAAQVDARPVLEGNVLLGEGPLTDGTVVLHHITDGAQGEVDSIALGADGSFRFQLPGAPDPARSDIFIASVRHSGVLYFGPAVTRVIELDSLYTIQAYDTLLASADGFDFPVEARNLFLDPDTGGVWRATDLFVLRNEEARTVVARTDGRTWGYPLPDGARDFLSGQGDLSLDMAELRDGALFVDAAIPPGQRVFVARYRLDSPFLSFPTPGVTEALDVFVRDPSPPVEIDGLEPTDRVELEEGGATYRRYSATDYDAAAVVIREGKEVHPPDPRWITVALAMILTVGGLMALRGGRTRTPAVPAPSREALLLEVARLDESLEARSDPTSAERGEYRRRRDELLRRIRSGA